MVLRSSKVYGLQLENVQYCWASCFFSLLLSACMSINEHSLQGRDCLEEKGDGIKASSFRDWYVFTSHWFPYRKIFCFGKCILLVRWFAWYKMLWLFDKNSSQIIPSKTDWFLALFFSFFLSSNVLAAYASFLWETEENEEDSTSQFQIPNHHEGAAAAANA